MPLLAPIVPVWKVTVPVAWFEIETRAALLAWVSEPLKMTLAVPPSIRKAVPAGLVTEEAASKSKLAEPP